jgi:hypothetical protein
MDPYWLTEVALFVPVAVALLSIASVYSPPDLPTFALVALPPFAGLGLGLAWLTVGPVGA